MPSDAAFPANIVDTLVGVKTPTPTGLWTLADVKTIEKNALADTSANGAIGVFTDNWVPLDWEIGAGEPRGRYYVYIQTLMKHAKRDEGAAISSKFVKSLRATLYRDSALKLALGGLNETILGVTERVLRWGVQGQRYQDNRINGAFVFASVTQCWFETEISS